MKNIFLHLGFIFILIGCSIICVDKVSASINNYYNDVNESNEIISLVHSNYNDFKIKSLEIKNDIEEVSKSFNIYLEEFQIVNEEISNKVIKVENGINDLSETINNMINYCVYDLNDGLMDKECSSFKINFNNMMDSYSKMINVYNEVIKEYNEYSILNGKEHVLDYNQKLDESIEIASAKLK